MSIIQDRAREQAACIGIAHRLGIPEQFEHRRSGQHVMDSSEGWLPWHCIQELAIQANPSIQFKVIQEGERYIIDETSIDPQYTLTKINLFKYKLVKEEQI